MQLPHRAGSLVTLRDRAIAWLAARYRDRFAAGRFRIRPVVGAPADDGVPVVMCAWARIPHTRSILEMLDAQADTPPLDLMIWNNRRRDHSSLRALIGGWHPEGAIRSVSVVRSPFNLGSVGRFYLARRLWLLGRRGPFIVFDDDQRLPRDFVHVALREFDPGSASGVWAWRIGGDYWQRQRAAPGERVDHLGPGGMVADLDLMADRAFFDELPLVYWFIDDVWFSHYAPRHGFELRRLPADVQFIDDEHNIYPGLVEQKIAFHDWLRNVS